MITEARRRRGILKGLVLFGFLAVLPLLSGGSASAQAPFTPTYTETIDEVDPSNPFSLPLDDDCPLFAPCKTMFQLTIPLGQPGFSALSVLLPAPILGLAGDPSVPDGELVGRVFGSQRIAPFGAGLAACTSSGIDAPFDFLLLDATTNEFTTTFLPSDLFSFNHWPIQLNPVRDFVLFALAPGSSLHARWVGAAAGSNILAFELPFGSGFLFVSVNGDPTAPPTSETCGPQDINVIILGATQPSLIPLFTCVAPGTQTFKLLLDPNDTSPGDQVTLFDTVTCGGANTTAGSNVTVPLTGTDAGSIELTFDNVTADGSTFVTGSTATEPPPTGFQLVVPLAGEGFFFFDVNTDASFTGKVTVCVTYDDSGLSLADEFSLQLQQKIEVPPGSGTFVFVNRTTSRDPTINEICGTANTLSIWAVLLPLDSTPPVISITTPEPFAVLPVGATLDFTATDAESGVESVIGHLDDGITTIDVSSGFPPPPGVYTLTVEAVDVAGNTAMESRSFIIFDPEVGFATGGGWFVPGGPTSDLGDTLPGLDSSSPAQFGFVVKYKPGATTLKGQLQFQYRQGNFNLHSNGIEWLVIVNNNWAKFQGTATIEGVDGIFPIRVDARDSDFGGSGQPDRFSIKIWAEGANPDLDPPIHKASGDLEGGSIIIHTK